VPPLDASLLREASVLTLAAVVAADDLARDIARSREFEMKTYIESMASMYQSSVTQNGMLFDLAMELTDEFESVSGAAILRDSRIVKILRYCVAPSISQMKFGQFFGLPSTEALEKERITKAVPLRKLEAIAPRIAKFVADHFDHDRFLWLSRKLSQTQRALAQAYARSWTCSLIADQNAQTEYRNWRKTLQETRIENELIRLGYTKSAYKGDVERVTDINVGSYSKERRVKGRTVQKADLVVHRKRGKRIVLVEAKAVGVEVDAYKRVKECCDKASDWRTNVRLENPKVVVVVAGFLTETNVSTLRAAKIEVVWEHRLGSLADVLA
jgi:hypothetical protein